MDSFERLNQVLDILRKECPWDRAQTIESLRYLTIEEVSELSEAILDNQPDEMRKELGDLFMHLLFYSKIASDRNLFSLDDVLHGICDKLMSRHPHIALPDRNGHMQGGEGQATPQWEKIKMREGRRSVLEGVPHSLPTLVKTIRMQEKTAGVGFEYPSADEALAKVREEFSELQNALQEQPDTASAAAEEEFGDLLFALVKWGGMLGINADDALAHANQKFKRRFSHVEEAARNHNQTIADLSPTDLLALWQEAKQKEQPLPPSDL